jgi:uncharacterized membrane protein YcaP (DUF421 family)
MESIGDAVQFLFGSSAEDLNWYQMALRSVVVYGSALLLVRIGEKRFMGEHTAFDLILAIILGSVISRGVNSVGQLFETILAGLILVGLHWLMAVVSFRSDRFGDFVKGSKRLLVEDGEILWDAMQRSHISKKDLLGQLRSAGSLEEVEKVKRAYIERSGKISVIEKAKEPKVLEVKVEAGVQTVRIQVE